MNTTQGNGSASAPDSSKSIFADEAPPSILVDGVDHFYGEGEFQKQALFSNCLEALPGEIVILTGPSGCGKTTLLTLIGALRKVQAGRVQVLSHGLSEMSSDALVDVRRNIGFIFQAHNLFGSLSAFENVRMALELHPSSASRRNELAIEMLTHLGLGDRIYYKPKNLSGGQRQRVAIARALVNRPKLILADEPTAALDEHSGNVVMELLRRFAAEEKSTVLIVTHDQRVLRSASRIVTMNFGRIVSNVLKEESTKICEFLARTESFKTLPPVTLAGIADKMSRERYRAGAVLFHQGDPGEKFYVVRRGVAEVYGEDKGGKFQKFLGPGESFGEIALLKDVPRTATVAAKEDLEVYSLGKADFKAAVDESESLSEQLWKVYFQRQ